MSRVNRRQSPALSRSSGNKGKGRVAQIAASKAAAERLRKEQESKKRIKCSKLYSKGSRTDEGDSSGESSDDETEVLPDDPEDYVNIRLQVNRSYDNGTFNTIESCKITEVGLQKILRACADAQLLVLRG